MSNDILIEKIIALVDGELDSEETSEILNSINQNPELQEEFNYHLKMKNVYSRMTEQPPSHLKSKILASSGLGFLFWKTKSFIISSISTGVVVATAIGYYFGLHETDIDKNIKIVDFVKKETLISLPELPLVYTNEVFANEKSNNYVNQISKQKIILEYLNSIKNNITTVENTITNNSEIVNNEIVKVNNNLESKSENQIDYVVLNNSKINNHLGTNLISPSNKKYRVRKIYFDDNEFKSFFKC